MDRGAGEVEAMVGGSAENILYRYTLPMYELVRAVKEAALLDFTANQPQVSTANSSIADYVEAPSEQCPMAWCILIGWMNGK